MAPSGQATPNAEQLAQLLQELHVRVGQLEGENGVLQSLVNTLGGGDGGKAKIDPPPKYGGDKETLTGFLTQTRSYLQYYPKKFADEAAKVTFVASRLEGKALR